MAVIVTETFSMNPCQTAAANVAGCTLAKTTTKSASIGVLHDEVVRWRSTRIGQKFELWWSAVQVLVGSSELSCSISTLCSQHLSLSAGSTAWKFVESVKTEPSFHFTARISFLLSYRNYMLHVLSFEMICCFQAHWLFAEVHALCQLHGSEIVAAWSWACEK